MCVCACALRARVRVHLWAHEQVLDCVHKYSCMTWLCVCVCVCVCARARVCTLVCVHTCVCVCVQAASLHAGSAKGASHSQATSTKSNLATAMGSDLKQLANLGPAKNTKKESKPAVHVPRPASLDSANNLASQERTSCSKDQLQALQKRCASSDDHYLYRVMDDGDMQLESCHRALQDANAFAHDIICECPYSDFAMEKCLLEGKSTKYIFTTRSPAYAIYDALALVEDDHVRCPLIVQIDIQKLPHETKIADFSLGSKAQKRKWEKYQLVVVKDCIPAHAVVGCFQIKSKEKDTMSQVLQQRVNGKIQSFQLWKQSHTDQQALGLMESCQASQAVLQWESMGKGNERPFAKLPTQFIEKMAVGRSNLMDHRILKSWKSDVAMLIIAVGSSHLEYLIQPDVISFPLPDNSALDEKFFRRIMIGLTDAILWHHNFHQEGVIFIHSKDLNRSAALAVVALMRLKGLGFENARENVDNYLKNSYGPESISKINTDLRNQIIKDEEHFKNAKDIQCSKSGQFDHIINYLKTLKTQYINHLKAPTTQLKSTGASGSGAGGASGLGKRQQETQDGKENKSQKTDDRSPAPAAKTHDHAPPPPAAAQGSACSYAVANVALESGSRQGERDGIKEAERRAGGKQDGAETRTANLEQKSKNKETEAVKGQIPDDEELKRVTHAILGKTSWKELSQKTVRRSMEKELGLGDGALDHRKGVIKEWVDDFVNSQEEEE